MPWQPMQVLALTRPAAASPAAATDKEVHSAAMAAAPHSMFFIVAPAFLSQHACAFRRHYSSGFDSLGSVFMELKVTAVSAALLGLLLVALATRISQLRVRHKVPWGDGGNPAL